MSRAHRNRSRVVASDSDSESEDGYRSSSLPRTSAEKEEMQRTIAMADLGTTTRDHITTVDTSRNARVVNVRSLLVRRDCNVQGTEAADRAAKNRNKLASWSNYGDTEDAKAGVGEILPDIAAGNYHRFGSNGERHAQEATLGRQLTLDDTYNGRSRRGGQPPNRIGCGGSHTTLNQRGNLAAPRGGGNAGRGLSHATSAANRPQRLDPAAESNHPEDLRAFSRRNLVATNTNNHARVTASANIKSAKNKDAPGKSNARNWLPPHQTGPPTKPKKDTSNPAMSPIPSSSPALSSRPDRAYGPTNHSLATTDEFMKAVRSTVPSKSEIPAGKAEPGLAASKYANKFAQNPPEVKPVEIHRLSRVEFRDPDLSPDKLTDALPSTGRLTPYSPSLISELAIDDKVAKAGLGIKIPDVESSEAISKKSPKSTSIFQIPDLMDTEVPDVKEDLLTPSTSANYVGKDSVVVTKDEAEILRMVQSYQKAKDSAGLLKYLGLIPTTPTTSASHAAAHQPKAAVDTDVSRNLDFPKDQPILGDKVNRPRGADMQPGPSLAASKWAAEPNQYATTTHPPGVSSLGVVRAKEQGAPLPSEASAQMATSNAKTNPFASREPLRPYDVDMLDYGGPVKAGTFSAATSNTFSFDPKPRQGAPFESGGGAVPQFTSSMVPLNDGSVQKQDIPMSAKDVPTQRTAFTFRNEAAPRDAKASSKTPSKHSKFGLTASKYATPDPQPVAEHVTPLFERSPNLVRQQPHKDVSPDHNTPIFGDSRNVSRLNKNAVTTATATANTVPAGSAADRFPGMPRPKNTFQPGAGFGDQGFGTTKGHHLQNYRANNSPESSESEL